MHWPTYVVGVVTGLLAYPLIKFIRGGCVAVLDPDWTVFVKQTNVPVAGGLYMREAFKRMLRHNRQVHAGMVANEWSVRYEPNNKLSR